jgi:hypothetical protein
MGKRKFEIIEKIINDNSRKCSYTKRTKGLLKKGIELSILCEQTVVIYIHDKIRNRVIHYCNDENFDILDLFNNDFDREFITNKDYGRVGGIT